MRTTVDIPNPLYRQLKARAASEGRSVKELIIQGVQSELRGRERARRGKIRLPIVPSRRPGAVRLDNASLYEIIPFP